MLYDEFLYFLFLSRIVLELKGDFDYSKGTRRWRSGQSHLAVNQAAYAYGGSNPSRRTKH